MLFFTVLVAWHNTPSIVIFMFLFCHILRKFVIVCHQNQNTKKPLKKIIFSQKRVKSSRNFQRLLQFYTQSINSGFLLQAIQSTGGASRNSGDLNNNMSQLQQQQQQLQQQQSQQQQVPASQNLIKGAS